MGCTLAALTPDPLTAIEVAERAGLLGRERATDATCTRLRLKAEGLAIRKIRRTSHR
ncbi:hypothetical protein [Methylobacterium sp. WL7]|uniref:hypothetical protein n=1 Tax=Methylobacterium sp. WL7 TaxID=2603900 RepID=UPI00164FDA69|nr:hypothetical protein [Methylobacterium sp. WL7]